MLFYFLQETRINREDSEENFQPQRHWERRLDFSIFLG